MAKRVGIVGIGIMGTAMMRNLVTDGFEVVGYDIAEQAMARLAKAGGITAASPRDVAEKADIVITSVPSVDAFEQVIAGQGGIASSNGKGQIVIECSTLPIDVKARGETQLAAQLEAGCRYCGRQCRATLCRRCAVEYQRIMK